jgi:hypothetical protein
MTSAYIIQPSLRECEPLHWPVELPKRDPRGILTGSEYTPFKKAIDSKNGVSSENPHVRWRRRCVLLSQLEVKAGYAFGFDPRVIDSREQYPFYNAARITSRLQRQERILANEVATLDFVLTIRVSGKDSYHAISIKPKEMANRPDVVRRKDREAAFCKSIGWSWQEMNEDAFDGQDFSNHLLMSTWMRATPLRELMAGIPAFSERLKSSRAQGSLERVLRIVTNRIGIDIDQGYRLFAGAVCLGWIRLLPKVPLRQHLPLQIWREP